ncbi:Fc.00g014650.m01.CDS01 [Cosmosporella sp. VM-42]
MSQRQQQRAAPAPSQTTTEPAPPETRTEPPRILRLRGHHTSTGRSVQWAEDVVDNEGLGRKSSKVCCIYHKPKAVDESSGESSSDSSDSDSDSGTDGAKPVGGKRDCGHDHGRRKRGSGSKKGKEKRSPSPNAYEKIPKVKPKDGDGGKTA